MSDVIPRSKRARGNGNQTLSWLAQAGRPRWLVVAGTVLAFALARPLLAADLSGTWEVSFRSGLSSQTIRLELVQRGSTVSGMGTLRSSDTDGAIQVQVRSGTASRGAFHIVLTETGGVASRGQDFVGKWYRDEMSGRTDGMLGTHVFTGVRRRLDR